MITKKLIIANVNKLKDFLSSEKYLFLAANGGNEKAVQAELAYILQKELDTKDYWVYLEKHRLDIAIVKNGEPSNNPEVIIELGHYTLNQKLVMDDNKFKPFTDVAKRANYPSSQIYHIMIFEFVQKTNPVRTNKYGFKRKASISDYEKKYIKKGVKFKTFPFLNNVALGYDIDVYLILAGPF